MKCRTCRERPVLAKQMCGRCYQRAVAADRPWRLCECGCGELTQGPRFVSGHNTRTLSAKEQRRRGRMNDGTKQRDRGAGKSYRKVGGRHEHRTVAEKKLGRKLRKGEIVHHKNGNKRDNRPSNLAVITQSEHARLHFKAYRADRRKS